MTINIAEALRYLNAAGADEKTQLNVKQAAEELEAWLVPRYVYKIFAMEQTENGVLLPEAGLLLPGKLAGRMLQTCARVLLLCCTLGAEFDRLLRQCQARDMAKAAILNACGSAYVEAGCDEAERAVAAKYPEWHLSDRFSPGYGDLPLSVQPGFLAAVDAEKRLGVTVTDTCLMLPAKSVTAIIGLSQTPQPARIRGCGHCVLRSKCVYRERGCSCEI